MKQSLKKYWWLFLMKGIVAIIFGLLIVFNPMVMIITFLSLFGVFLIFTGVILITLAFLGETENTIIRAIEGILFILMGIVIMLNPLSAAGGLMIMIAAWAIISGLLQIVSAIRLRKVIENDIMMFISGVISIIFGVVLAGNLIQGAEIITIFFGLFAILTGILNTILAINIRKLIITSDQ
ncbi:MAG: DUF308 domain-containing protein [Ignavibacteria bacterium]|nr:DUF308 domain-containing protein [Ignavibacteria bacterium]